MAQSLAPGVRHLTEWGDYQIEIDARYAPHGDVIAKIRSKVAPFAGAEERFGNMNAAVTWVAGWLERHHCGAFVDGKKRPLVDFLIFVPATGGVAA